MIIVFNKTLMAEVQLCSEINKKYSNLSQDEKQTNKQTDMI